MPIFDFECDKCGSEFEFLVLRRQDPVNCPACRDDQIKKRASLFTCTSVQLDKRLKMDSEDKMKKGLKMLEKQKFRQNRIKIL